MVNWAVLALKIGYTSPAYQSTHAASRRKKPCYALTKYQETSGHILRSQTCL